MKGTITLTNTFLGFPKYQKAIQTFEAMGFTHLPEQSFRRLKRDNFTYKSGITLAFPPNSAEKVLSLIAYATAPEIGYKVESCTLDPNPSQQHVAV